MSALLPLRYRVRSYHWGSRTFLGKLRGASVPTPQPEAELWIGVHPGGESEVLRAGEWTLLTRALVEELADEVHRVAPFLLKVLAIDEPLSLQVHPDATQASEGYARERAAQVPEAARSYRDRGAKSELLVALEPVWALRGLRHPEDIGSEVQRHGLQTLLDATTGGAGEAPVRERLRSLMEALLTLEEGRKHRLLEEVARALDRAHDAGRDAPLFWVRRLAQLYPGDPAVVAPLFMTLVRLEPGQALAQPPGALHCYLEGAGVEVMSSSDNVVRAGLTSKAVDAAELLRIADFEPGRPEVLEAVELAPGTAEFPCPTTEFRLVRLRVSGSSQATWKPEAALALGLCTQGEGRLTAVSTGEALKLWSGCAFAALEAGGPLLLEGDAELFCATGRAG